MFFMSKIELYIYIYIYSQKQVFENRKQKYVTKHNLNNLICMES